jgi:hypothetical protein
MLTARQLNRGAKIVAAVREEENAPLLKQSGADVVITRASAAGRLLGLSVFSPPQAPPAWSWRTSSSRAAASTSSSGRS